MTRNISIASLQNLPQYKDKTPEELAEIILHQESKQDKKSSGLQARISIKLAEFSEDYEISDLKYNDRETLRSMMIALINLEDLDKVSFEITSSGITYDNLTLMDRINSMSSKLRADISKMQDDLKISRKSRNSGKEESVVAYIENLKLKAQEFSETKMNYIFCPKCNMLLSTVWILYEDEKHNIITLKCKRKLEDDAICGETVRINLLELKDVKTNKVQLLPETIR